MNEKIRIVHIAQAAGGVERYLQMLLKYADKEKYENILICSQDYDAQKFEGLATVIEQEQMQREIGLHDFSTVWKVRRLLKKYRPDVVYTHSSKAGAIGRVARIGIKCKCIYNPHGWSFNMRGSSKKQAMYSAIEKFLALLCNKIVCISNAEKRSALERKICRESKLQVIFNGVDISAYDQNTKKVQREALKIPADAFVVGMVGRLSEQKAPDVFIRAAQIIKKRIPNAFFIIVGSGDMHNEVQQFAEEQGFADSLLITGWIDDPAIYVNCFDVAMLLSRWEGFGLVLPEYMLAQKPVVATAVDAIPDIITHGENGLLVPVDDCSAAAEAICELFQNRELAGCLIKNGIACAHEKFRAERVSQETERMIAGILRNVSLQEV